MSGKIQGADIKTEAELITAGGTAADLPHDSQVYVSAGAVNKTLDDAITDGDLAAKKDLSNLTSPTSVNQDLAMNGNKLTNIGAPASNNDAVNRDYSDAELGAVLIPTAGGTTNLTNTSPQFMLLTGTLDQTIVLPDFATVPVGRKFVVVNRSTGLVTVKNFTGSTVLLLTQNTRGEARARSAAQFWFSNIVAVFEGSGFTPLSAASKRIFIQAISADPGLSGTFLGRLYNADSSGGAFNIQLPDPALLGSGYYFEIMDISGAFAANNVTLLRFGSEAIQNVGANYALNTNFGFYKIYTNGINWWVG